MRRIRLRFSLRTLLIVATILPAVAYLRPLQLKPNDISNGTSKASVAWNCGMPASGSDATNWIYREPAVKIEFDENGRVSHVFDWQKYYDEARELQRFWDETIDLSR